MHNTMHFFSLMESTDNSDTIERRIHNRDVVGITALLTLYYLMINKKSFNEDGIADHPAVVNIPVIVGFRGNTGVQFERWATWCIQTHYRARLTNINSMHAQQTQIENDMRVTQAAIVDGEDLQRNLQRLDRIHEAKASTIDQIHQLTWEVMCEMSICLHDANARTPRTIHADEAVTFIMVLEELKLLISINEDKATLHEYIDGFLLSSFLAGVEGGVPVVPIDAELYMNTTFYHDVFVTALEIQFPTTDQHRGEAAWKTDQSAILPLTMVEKARRWRDSMRAMQEMLDKLNVGIPLSDGNLDCLQVITNTPRPLAFAASMLTEPINESESLEPSNEHELPEPSNEHEPHPLSMELLGQSRFRGMTLEEVRACLARDRAAERR